MKDDLVRRIGQKSSACRHRLQDAAFLFDAKVVSKSRDLRHVVHADAMLLQRAFDRLVGRDVLLEADEVLAVELLDLDRLLLRERVRGAADQDQTVLAKGDQLDLRAFGRVRDHADVQRAAEHVLVDLVDFCTGRPPRSGRPSRKAEPSENRRLTECTVATRTVPATMLAKACRRPSRSWHCRRSPSRSRRRSPAGRADAALGALTAAAWRVPGCGSAG